MKKVYLFLTMMVVCGNLAALNSKVWVGPHFNYTRVKYKALVDPEGCGAGVTAGGEVASCSYFANVEFEGTWNMVFNFFGNGCTFNDYLVDGRLGYIFSTDRFLVKPYTGFGWNLFENTEIPDSRDLHVNFHKLFVPLGVYIMYCPFSCFRGGLQLEYRFDVSSRLEFFSTCMRLKNEHSFRVQLPLEYTYNRSLSAALVPFYEWNKFGECRENLMEISSLTCLNIGLKLLVGGQF